MSKIYLVIGTVRDCIRRDVAALHLHQDADGQHRLIVLATLLH